MPELDPAIIDPSAVVLTSALAPNLIKRETRVPRAALAIWSTLDDMVALQGEADTSGRWFPQSEELPEIANAASRPRQIIDFLLPLIESLGLPPGHIRRISGLVHRSPLSSLIARPEPGRQQRTVLLPYKVTIDTRPQLPGMAWYPLDEAAIQLDAHHALVGKTILKRMVEAA